MDANEKTIKRQIDECVELLRNILGNDLLGVYLYGSSIMGGLLKYSDIDLFAVTKRTTTVREKGSLETSLLKISGIYSISTELKPIELIIVVESDINPWKYPPMFDFQYGDWMRKDFEAGRIEPWKTKYNPNLALIITQLLLSHKVLFGPNPDQLLPQISYGDFFKALTSEVNTLIEDLDYDTRNVLLTLTRIWCTLETDTIRSKADAASWTIEKLPCEYRPVLARAKSVLLGETNERWDDIYDNVKSCAIYMTEVINKLINSLDSNTYSQKTIKIA